MRAPIITITAALLAASLDSGAQDVDAVPLPLAFENLWEEGRFCFSVETADFNGDGADELLCNSLSGVWQFACGGWFQTGVSGPWRSITVGDYDGDGYEDAVITAQFGFPVLLRAADPGPCP